MNTDFFRDKKLIIIICVSILLLTIGGVITAITFTSDSNNSGEVTPQVLTEEEKAIRDRENAELHLLYDQLYEKDLSDSERQDILDKIDESRSS